MTAGNRIEIRIEFAAWRTVDQAVTVCRDAACAALTLAPSPWRDAGISVLLTDDSTLRQLNQMYRGRDAATNVLSFPQVDVDQDQHIGSVPGAELLLGDIALAFETVAREADDMGKPLADHLRHLIVHGVLHLLGYDHVIDADATKMEAAETRVLAGLGVPDPYQDVTVCQG